MKEKGLGHYMEEASRISGTAKGSPLKIALLSSFTIRGLGEVLKVKCNEISVDSEIYEAGYNQISQEVVDKGSGLNKFEPSITFLLINPKHVLGESSPGTIKSKGKRKAFIEEKSSEFIQTINSFARNVSGILVVSNLKRPSYSPLGITEGKTEMSAKDMVAYFNRKLKESFLKSHRVFVYDFAGFFTRFGEYNIVNEKMNYLGDMFIAPDFIPVLAEDLMAYVKACCSKGRKCIVLDLDNTLWGGILGEDGFDNIKLDNKPPGNAFLDFQRHILELHKRGIILAINSKNNLDEAMKVIRKHPYMALREKHFASIKINWRDKATNMKEISREINIGTDSVVFIDDDPLNRELVKRAMPDVLVVDLPKDPALYVRALKEINDLSTLQLTKEDFKRGKMYYQQRQRAESKGQFTDLEGFLKSLGIEVGIKKATGFTVPRISQLTQKTNQFNLTTKRYTEADIKKFAGDSSYFVYSVSVRDKFGDNGLTGAIILKREGSAFKIDTFLLSCRVIGRGVEKAMLSFISGLAMEKGVGEILGEYIPTGKNKPCEKMYAENGYEEAGKNSFRLTNLKKPKPVDYIKVETE